MSERERFDAVKVRLKVAQMLTKVETMYAELPEQAYSKTNDRDFPGGMALNMLAPASVPQDWQRVYDYAETHDEAKQMAGYAWDNEAGEDSHPVSVLAFWTRVIREERNQDEPRSDPTLVSEVGTLRRNLDWMCRVDIYGDPEWFEVTEVERDLETLVRRMQDVLDDGPQIDTGMPCLTCGTKLKRNWAGSQRDPKTEYDDTWSCPKDGCNHPPYTHADYLLAEKAWRISKATWLGSDDMSARMRVKVSTIQSWASKDLVHKRRNIQTGRVEYRVADVETERDRAALRHA